MVVHQTQQPQLVFFHSMARDRSVDIIYYKLTQELASVPSAAWETPNPYFLSAWRSPNYTAIGYSKKIKHSLCDLLNYEKEFNIGLYLSIPWSRQRMKDCHIFPFTCIKNRNSPCNHDPNLVLLSACITELKNFPLSGSVKVPVLFSKPTELQ